MTAKKDKDAEHSVGAAQPDKSKGEVPNPVDPLLYEAFGLVSEDHKERASFDHPYELQLRKLFVHDWLRTLAKDLAGGKYGPKAAAPIDVPKPKWHVRPGARLTLEDEVVYTYLLIKAKKAIAASLKWSENTLRFSHLLSAKKGQFFRDEFLGWDRKTLPRSARERSHACPYNRYIRLL